MKKLLLLAFSISALGLGAQSYLSLYNFNHINQNLLVNPASPHNYRFVIGLPGLGGVSNHTNLSSIGAEFLESGEDVNQKLSETINGLEPSDRVNLNQSIDGIFVGFGTKRGYWTVAAQQVTDLNMNVPSNLLKFAYFGNVGSGNLGQTVNLGGIGAELNVRNEYSVGYQHYVDSNLIIGGRYKYISGIAHAHLDRSDINVTSDIDLWTIQTDVLVKSAGVYNVQDDLSNNLGNYVSGGMLSRNAGMGFDLGAHYKINENFDVSLSILNLGWVTWRNDLRGYGSQGNFEFEGIDIDYPLDSIDFDWIVDSLESKLNFTETNISEYTTPLPSHFIVSGQYHLTPKHVFGLLYQGSTWNSNLYHNYGVMYNGRYSKWFNLMVGYSVIDNTFNNLSLGVSVRLGPFQIYALTDNTFGYLDPSKIRSTNVRAGVTLSFLDKPKELKTDK